MSELNEYLMRSRDCIAAAIENDLTASMDTAVNAIVNALARGNPLLICGNGGSASDAMHIAAELVSRFLKERRGYNVIALPANGAILTGWSNDYSFDTVFARQVEAHSAPGGVLLAISTSGNSKNVILAAEAAKKQEMVVVGLTGQTGGDLAPLCDVLLATPSTETPLIQQLHLCLYHFMCECVEQQLSERDARESRS